MLHVSQIQNVLISTACSVGPSMRTLTTIDKIMKHLCMSISVQSSNALYITTAAQYQYVGMNANCTQQVRLCKYPWLESH